MDKVNPIVSSKLAAITFTNYTRYDEGRKGLLRAQLERMRSTEGLSDNLTEIVDKCCAM